MDSAMTTISFGPIQPFQGAAALADGSPMASSSAGASFADTLLALLDRALVETPGQPEDRFAGGTMKSSVEVFDEHGFFEDRAPTDRQEPESPLASGPAAAPVSQLPFRAASALFPLQSASTNPPVTVTPEPPLQVGRAPGVLASDLAVDSQVSIADGLPVAPLEPGASEKILASAAPVSSLPAPRLRATGMMVENPTAQERLPQSSLGRNPATLAASRVRVSLDHCDAGVAVSVVADIGPDGDAGSMHDAVSHLLARHGLVLSELRVTRRPGADGQDRKD
jgi:hypothetical protein